MSEIKIVLITEITSCRHLTKQTVKMQFTLTVQDFVVIHKGSLPFMHSNILG